MTKHEIELKEFIDIEKIIDGKIKSTILPEREIIAGDKVVFKSAGISSDVFTITKMTPIKAYYFGFYWKYDFLQLDSNIISFREMCDKWGIEQPLDNKIQEIFEGKLYVDIMTNGEIIYWDTEEKYLRDRIYHHKMKAKKLKREWELEVKKLTDVENKLKLLGD